MAEYIDRERVIQEIKDMDNCGCITRSVNHVCENMRSIPTADVIERSKIDKAIEEMERDSTRYEYIDRHDLADVVDSCIGTILKYIKE